MKNKIDVNNLDVDKIKALDNVGSGVYKIELVDGTVEEIFLEQKTAEGLQTQLKDRLEADKEPDVKEDESDGNKPSGNKEETGSDEKSSEEEKIDELPPEFSQNPLSRDLSHNFSHVEITLPGVTGYWPIQEDIPRFKKAGYIFCKPEWVKDYEVTFSHIIPGQGASPDGRIMLNGHTLMVAKKEVAQAKHDYYYNQRDDARETIAGNLSLEEMRQRGLKV